MDPFSNPLTSLLPRTLVYCSSMFAPTRDPRFSRKQSAGSARKVRNNVDFRLVAATAHDLVTAVAEGAFREDLYYRLNVVAITLPPLRGRREDIPLLVQRFLSRSERPASIRQDALDRILAHDWPGNVRELENVITRAVVLAPGGVITPEVIEFPSTFSPLRIGSWESNVPYRDGYWPVLRRVEMELIRAALREAGGNKTEAARILGVQRRLLYQKMAELDLK